ncbi:MAG: hypothetical protein B5M48_00060 [Candidatus Omnitrophica bacterium 4484_213]|nr:MAG: hypothetical protein B5M48_00060 [Candidatus Omnitrophica bacterium 4484_213]
MKAIKFGTDGWRGEISRDFTFENVELVAQAIADYFTRSPLPAPRSPQVIVGYDTRFLSREFAQTVSRVLVANDIKVILSNQYCPTPTLSRAIVTKKARAGIMITASHNPYYFNGIKIKGDFGGSVESDVTEEIENLLGKNRPKILSWEECKESKNLEVANFLPDYKKSIKSYIDFRLLRSSKKKWKVLVDSMFGTGNGIIEDLLKETNIKVTTIHSEQNPLFPRINPEPIPKNLKEAARLLKNGDYDLAVITDGDADRIGALRPDGKFITPSLILSLTLLHFLKYRRWRGGVVKTISSSSLIDKITQRYNLKLWETPIGFKHICALMRKEDILIGGEESGGIGYKNYLFERDGILSALLLTEVLCAEKRGILGIIKDIEKEFGRFRYDRIDIHYPEEKKKGLMANLKKNPPSRLIGKRVVEIKKYDGVKLICSDGSWLLLRLSGTEPILRIYAEAGSEKEAERLLGEGKKIAYRT